MLPNSEHLSLHKTEYQMAHKQVRLANCVHWDRHRGDKVYMDKLKLSVTDLPFTLRHVVLRFTDGPAIDLSIYDMDRIVMEYLRQRGVKRPSQVLKLPKCTAPPACDFLVPNPAPSKSRRSVARRATRR
jgi:hypothetical protein